MGGLIKYVSKRPDLNKFLGQAQIAVSETKQGGTSHNVAGAINVPIVADKLAVRLSGFNSHDGGYIDDISLDRQEVNRSDTYGGRADLLFSPSDVLSIRVTGFLQNIDRNGQGTADYLLSGSPETGPLVSRRFVPEPFTQQYRLASGTVDYDLGSATLTSISSYQEVASDIGYDITRQQLSRLINPPFNRSYSAYMEIGRASCRERV